MSSNILKTLLTNDIKANKMQCVTCSPYLSKCFKMLYNPFLLKILRTKTNKHQTIYKSGTF